MLQEDQQGMYVKSVNRLPESLGQQHMIGSMLIIFTSKPKKIIDVCIFYENTTSTGHWYETCLSVWLKCGV